MNAAPPVHAVVVNYNAGAWLQRSVRSLLAAPEVQRLTLVDNASTDASWASLPDDSRLTLIRNGVNRGYATAANQGAAAGDEPFVLLANPDLEIDSGTVGALLQAMQAHADVGIAGAAIRDPDGGPQRACRRRQPTPARSLITMLGLERLGLTGVNIPGAQPSEPQIIDAVSGALLMVRRDCWAALAGFDERYFLHCEDLDLFARAQAVGWKLLFVPDAGAVHAKGVSQQRRRWASERDKHRGMVRYYRRFFAAQMPLLLRWCWPALIWSRFALLSPVWALQDRLGRGT